MQLWKRIATLSLMFAVTFISLFWITAFTTAKVAHLESGEATSVAAISATPIGFSKTSTIKKVDEITLHNGRNDRTCLPAISDKPANKHPVRGHTA